jgi:hypothetical protein
VTVTFAVASSEDVAPDDVDMVLQPATAKVAIRNAARNLVMLIIAASSFGCWSKKANPEPQPATRANRSKIAGRVDFRLRRLPLMLRS